jgi:hypothetical protein
VATVDEESVGCPPPLALPATPTLAVQTGSDLWLRVPPCAEEQEGAILVWKLLASLIPLPKVV